MTRRGIPHMSKKWPKRRIIPASSERGLSSSLNRKVVLQIFASSTAEEITQVLSDSRFGPLVARLRRAGSNADSVAMLRQDAQGYLQTTEGIRRAQAMREELLRSSIADWFKSAVGQETFS